MSLFGDGLEAAVQKAFTRPAPKSAPAQMRYLVRQLKSTKAVAQMLRISQRTVERYVKDQIRRPRPELAARLEREVKKRWQPQIRARARKRAATTDGIVIDTQARIGYTAPVGTTDDARVRHLTVALPPQYAARLFDAQQAGATDQQLQQIAAAALKEVYF
ncbi:telomere-protecting terminal protein Tpg, partial [Streptomyces pharetrae]